jgi:hypothetical protein
MSEPITAPLAQFGKRHRIVQPASDIPNPVRFFAVGITKLSGYQGGKVPWMESVSDLKARKSPRLFRRRHSGWPLRRLPNLPAAIDQGHWESHISVENFAVDFWEGLPIQFRPRTNQAIDPKNLDPLDSLEETSGESRTDESANASDEKPHG